MPKPSILPANLAGAMHPIRPSALPGETRQTSDSLAGSEAAWHLRCALAAGEVIRLDTLGQSAQLEITALIRARLACLAESAQSLATEHLSRLHVLLTELVEALAKQGWRSMNRAGDCWRRRAPEISELATTLSSLLPDLLSTEQTVTRCRDDLVATLEALQVAITLLHEVMPALTDKLAFQAEQRLHELLATRNLGEELALLLAADQISLSGLQGRLRQGVLLQLPGIQLLLAESMPRLNPTRQRGCLQAVQRLFESMENPA